MDKKLVSDLIVDYLARRDVEYVFGLCGHTVIGMLDAFNRNPKVKYISNRHEAVASTAADGDQYKILEPVCKRCWRIDDVEALPYIMDKAFRLAESGRPGLREQIAQAKADFKASVKDISEDSRFPMTPQRILHDVKAAIPEDAVIFTDVGWNKNGVAQQFDITVPGPIHHSSGLATMGFGASAVLGGKLAAPDRICLTLTGDGGFGVNPTCLATAVEQGIACTWVVMNNSAFGTIAGLENANYNTKFGTVFHTPDSQPYTPQWAEVARAYGVESIRCASAEEFLPAMEKAIAANKAGKPFLVEAPMENIVVPTPGCWNINDIYSPNELVKEGKLVKKENGQYVAPSHSKSHNAK